jgi:UDP-N-acetylmuramoylalanine--D-glutamate ligase
MRFSELDGARIGVWGAGRELVSFAEQLGRRLPSAHIETIVLDGEPPRDVRERLGAPQARVLGAADAVAALGACEVVVRSPGVSIHRSELSALRAQGVPVTTATALWLAEHGARGVVGVTGTKGKSTTAALIAQLLGAGGVRAELAGNIGVPALDLLDIPDVEVAVVELSSYQIADLEQGPQVAVLTNLFAEHADWHGSHERYRAEKLRLFALPGVEACVLGAREEQAAALAPRAAEVLRFGTLEGWHASHGGGLAWRGELVVAPEQMPLRGEHNALNLAAALTAVQALGRPRPSLSDALSGFRALPHRLEVVCERGGATWVDDSISTTPESALAALASFSESAVILIAGGQDRGQQLDALARELARRGADARAPATLIALPTTGPRLLAQARAAGLPEQRGLERADLAQAVELARELAAPGAVVLLSPAAPSYDHYRDFEERGERFRSLAAAGAG